jgi:hypothetical protein
MLSNDKVLRRGSSKPWKRGHASEGPESSALARISTARWRYRFGSSGWATDADPSSSRSVSSNEAINAAPGLSDRSGSDP